MEEYLQKGTVGWPRIESHRNRTTLLLVLMWWAAVLVPFAYYLMPAILAGSKTALYFTGGFSTLGKDDFDTIIFRQQHTRNLLPYLNTDTFITFNFNL